MTTDRERFETLILNEPVFGEPLRFCLRHLRPQGGAVLVDIGCGEGTVSALFARRGFRVVGLDVDGGMLAGARRRAEESPQETLLWLVQGAAEQMPLRSACVDVVFSRSTMQYVDKGRVLAECQRVLKPGGTLVMVENLSSNFFVQFFRAVRPVLPGRALHALGTIPGRRYLRFDEITGLQAHFDNVQHQEYYLVSVLTYGLRTLFRRARWAQALDAAARRFDTGLTARFPMTRRFTWIAGIAALGKKPGAGA